MGIKRTLGLIILACGVGVALYNTLLTDDAKESLHNSYLRVKEAYGQIKDNLIDVHGIVMEESELPNQESTRLQWEALGF